jgi:hypothetical protein
MRLEIALDFKVEVRGEGTFTFTADHVTARLHRLRTDPPASLTAEEVAEEIAFLEALPPEP